MMPILIKFHFFFASFDYFSFTFFNSCRMVVVSTKCLAPSLLQLEQLINQGQLSNDECFLNRPGAHFPKDPVT